MGLAFFLFRATARHDRLTSLLKRKPRPTCTSLSWMSRRLGRTPWGFYGVVVALLLGSFCIDLVMNASVFIATPVWHSDQFVYSDSGPSQTEDTATSPPHRLPDAKRLNGFHADVSTTEETEQPHESKRVKKSSGPPAYLPLAQHLKYVNYTKKGSSLQDMVYGAQKRTYPDLEPTDNFDLLNCVQCSEHSNTLGLTIPRADHQLQLARLAVRLVAFYNLSSMLVLPCAEEFHWILPLKAAIRKFSPRFEVHCVVSSDKMVVDLMKSYDRRVLTGSHFVVYRPMSHGNLPKVDVMFTWRGLEQYDLEAIHEVFKEAVKKEIKYILVGNSPGFENAKMVETGSGIFSIKRPEVPALNVRAYPFGFKEALRVFSLVGKQLLFYKTSDMRDGW